MKKLAVPLIVCGIILLAWSAWTFAHGDPVTSYLAHRSQATLMQEFRHGPPPTATHPMREGHAAMLITIPKLGLWNIVVVQGTRMADLDKGPGHYRYTSWPGSGGWHVIMIAGHRTTWGAWFRHIDSLRAGDLIVLRTRYGVYAYHVTGHRVVYPTDLHVLRKRPWEKLVLTSCHPPYSAEFRYVIFAARV